MRLKESKYIEGGNRYFLDAALHPSDGWCQMDTKADAEYFGHWINVRTLELISYMEGDYQRWQAADEREFKTGLEAWKDQFDRLNYNPVRIDCMCDERNKRLFSAIGLEAVFEHNGSGEPVAEIDEEIGPLQVCQSAAGFYIGRLLTSGEPYSRDSETYYQTRDEAENALRAREADQRKTSGN